MNILCGFEIESDSVCLIGSKRETARILFLQWNTREAVSSTWGDSKTLKKERSEAEE